MVRYGTRLPVRVFGRQYLSFYKSPSTADDAESARNVNLLDIHVHCNDSLQRNDEMTC